LILWDCTSRANEFILDHGDCDLRADDDPFVSERVDANNCIFGVRGVGRRQLTYGAVAAVAAGLSEFVWGWEGGRRFVPSLVFGVWEGEERVGEGVVTSYGL